MSFQKKVDGTDSLKVVYIFGIKHTTPYAKKQKKKVKQFHYKPGVAQGVFQEVNVPRFRDNGTGWW
jgi:hypothetical protein